jgi:hypothetical protein
MSWRPMAWLKIRARASKTFHYLALPINMLRVATAFETKMRLEGTLAFFRILLHEKFEFFI